MSQHYVSPASSDRQTQGSEQVKKKVSVEIFQLPTTGQKDGPSPMTFLGHGFSFERDGQLTFKFSINNGVLLI
jgi:hypothetical protein